MKRFIKNNGQAIVLVIFLATVIFAAGRIHTTQAELCRQIQQKVNQELYNREIKHIDERLRRIEDKIDVLIRANPGIVIDGRGQDPCDRV